MFKFRYLIFIVSGIILMLCFSCSNRVYKGAADIVIYPPPPDTTRIQFLTTISNSLDVTGKRSGVSRFVLGEEREQRIVKPYGISVRNGKVYTCDTGLDCLEIMDLKNGTFEFFEPTGLGQLKKPINCYVDENDYLYVSDAGRKQIVVFDPSGGYVSSFDGGDDEDFKPTDVFVQGDKIWVTNFVNHKVLVYNKDTYELLFTIPDSEVGNEDYLYSPTNIWLTDDRVYVCDFGDFKVKAYTLEGEFIMSVGSYGKQIGQFVRPKGIAVDRESNLYVVDAGFENTQIFSKDGKMLMFFGGPYNKPGDMWLPAQVTIDYDNLQYFKKYVSKNFKLKYLIFVTNQYGPDKINVYGYVELKK